MTTKNEYLDLATAHEVVRRASNSIRLGADHRKIVAFVQQETANIALSGISCTPDASIRFALRAISHAIQPFENWRTPQQIISAFCQSEYCTSAQVLEHLDSADRALWNMCEAFKADLNPGRNNYGSTAGVDDALAVGVINECGVRVSRGQLA